MGGQQQQQQQHTGQHGRCASSATASSKNENSPSLVSVPAMYGCAVSLHQHFAGCQATSAVRSFVAIENRAGLESGYRAHLEASFALHISAAIAGYINGCGKLVVVSFSPSSSSPPPSSRPPSGRCSAPAAGRQCPARPAAAAIFVMAAAHTDSGHAACRRQHSRHHPQPASPEIGTERATASRCGTKVRQIFFPWTCGTVRARGPTAAALSTQKGNGGGGEDKKYRRNKGRLHVVAACPSASRVCFLWWGY